jgi:hypothetical protein
LFQLLLSLWALSCRLSLSGQRHNPGVGITWSLPRAAVTKLFQVERNTSRSLEPINHFKGLRASGPPNSIVFRSAAWCRSATVQNSAAEPAVQPPIGSGFGTDCGAWRP